MPILEPRPLLLSSLLLLAACGPKAVQLYDGPKLDESEVTYMWSNPHLKITIDRQHDLGNDGGLKKLELPRGHHVAEARCVYSQEVPYHPAKGVDPSAGTSPPKGQYTESPPIAVVMDGEAGRQYKPRVHFEKHPGDLPGCHVKMFDVTDESGGQKNDLY